MKSTSCLHSIKYFLPVVRFVLLILFLALYLANERSPHTSLQVSHLKQTCLTTVSPTLEHFIWTNLVLIFSEGVQRGVLDRIISSDEAKQTKITEKLRQIQDKEILGEVLEGRKRENCDPGDAPSLTNMTMGYETKRS